MIHHISISAHNPRHVADVLAEILGGQAFPFFPNPESYIAFAADENGSAIKVYPLGCEITPANGAQSYQHSCY